MFVLSKWQRVALLMRWCALVLSLFYWYLTFLDHRTNISRKVRAARTEARQRVGSPKQVSKLSLGQNKHGQNIITPVYLWSLERRQPGRGQAPEWPWPELTSQLTSDPRASCGRSCLPVATMRKTVPIKYNRSCLQNPNRLDNFKTVMFLLYGYINQ